jgi:hypothetical protein
MVAASHTTFECMVAANTLYENSGAGAAVGRRSRLPATTRLCSLTRLHISAEIDFSSETNQDGPTFGIRAQGSYSRLSSSV